MNYFLALLPIILVVALMFFRRWGSAQAGMAGWVAGLLVAHLAFGMNWQVWWVSQAKGLLLSLNVLLVLWSALFLYNLVAQFGGIRAVADGLLAAIPEPGWLQIILAWSLSAMVEGVAGFGLPIAIVAPMLMGLGVPAVTAVAASAIGHAWVVTFGNMAVVLQMLASVVHVDEMILVPAASLLLGIACLVSGLVTAAVLGQLRYAKRVILVGIGMALAQAAAARIGLVAMAGLLASAAGIGMGILLSRKSRGAQAGEGRSTSAVGLKNALLAYGLLMALMVVTTLVQPLHGLLAEIVWKVNFPAVQTNLGAATAAGPGHIFRPFLHPATLIFISAVVSYDVFRRQGIGSTSIWAEAGRATLRASAPATAGVLCMVGLSTMMEHTGMTMLLAQGLAALTGSAFPLVSPLIGMLGAFATGSNSNSNVLFGPLQNNVATALQVDQATLLAGQTAGGSIGSMIAPAKLAVGCSTTGLKNQEGLVLRKTLPAGLGIGLLLGAITWLLARG